MLPDWRAPKSLKTRAFSRRRRSGRALWQQMPLPSGALEPPLLKLLKLLKLLRLLKL